MYYMRKFFFAISLRNSSWKKSLNTLQRARYQPVNHELVLRFFDRFILFDSALFFKYYLNIIIYYLFI